jgi:hypothetical protein
MVSTIPSMQQPVSIFNQISPRFGFRPYELVQRKSYGKNLHN